MVTCNSLLLRILQSIFGSIITFLKSLLILEVENIFPVWGNSGWERLQDFINMTQWINGDRSASQHLLDISAWMSQGHLNSAWPKQTSGSASLGGPLLLFPSSVMVPHPSSISLKLKGSLSLSLHSQLVTKSHWFLPPYVSQMYPLLSSSTTTYLSLSWSTAIIL